LRTSSSWRGSPREYLMNRVGIVLAIGGAIGVLLHFEF
jgi:hypothetical protein